MTEVPAKFLDPGETVLWTGGPDGPWFLQRLLVRGAVLACVVYALFTWIGPMLGRGEGLFRFAVWLLLIVGFVLFCWRMSALSNRLYAITSRRALIWRKDGEARLHFFPLGPDTVLETKGKRRGVIRFTTPALSAPWLSRGSRFRFEYVADLPRVTGLLQGVQKGSA